MEILIELLFRLLFDVPIVRLIFLAVIPSVFLIRYVWNKDRLEPEPPKLVWSLVGLGVLSVLPVMALELGGLAMLNAIFKEENALYMIVHWFLVVGVSEELCKYMMMRLKTWKSPDFNCFFDAMVYSAAVSAGFALAENIMYGLKYGTGVLLVRALVSIPAHICFSVFMGAWYGSAKRFAAAGDVRRARRAHLLSVTIPAAAHGAFDILASNSGSAPALVFFFVYVGAMFIFCWRMLKNRAERDAYIDREPGVGGPSPQA